MTIRPIDLDSDAAADLAERITKVAGVLGPHNQPKFTTTYGVSFMVQSNSTDVANEAAGAERYLLYITPS